jgi:HEPN domain-containing protein
MKNIEMAKDYLSRAKYCLREAEEAMKDRNYPICIRRTQESLELASKSLLRYFGIEYPKEHDVGDALNLIKDRLPENIAKKVQDFQSLLTELAKVRGPALYGYEREGIPASKAFGKEYAEGKLNSVKELVLLYIDFIG